MPDIPIDDLLNKTGSMYKLVTLTFLRAVEINGGAAKLVDSKPEEKDVSVALREIMEDKISYKEKEK